MTSNYKNEMIFGDCMEVMPSMESGSVDCIVSDIPYGISFDEWDVLHNNKNKALLGSSPAQAGKKIFAKRGKPLNGWSKEDKNNSILYQKWCEKWGAEWFRLLKPAASAFVFAGRRYSARCIIALENCGFILKDQLCWYKYRAPFRAQRVSKAFERRGDMENAKKWEGWRLGNLAPFSEPILWLVKPYKIGGTLLDCIAKDGLGAFNYDYLDRHNIGYGNVLYGMFRPEFDGEKLHPTQKPIGLLKTLIGLVTIEGQIVLDPFAGSGSTCVAAKELGRSFVGIEKNKDYFEKAKKRLGK